MGRDTGKGKGARETTTKAMTFDLSLALLKRFEEATYKN
jgi:hypothetical protein